MIIVRVAGAEVVCDTPAVAVALLREWQKTEPDKQPAMDVGRDLSLLEKVRKMEAEIATQEIKSDGLIGSICPQRPYLPESAEKAMWKAR